jgi:hypothetical protein
MSILQAFCNLPTHLKNFWETKIPPEMRNYLQARSFFVDVFAWISSTDILSFLLRWTLKFVLAVLVMALSGLICAVVGLFAIDSGFSLRTCHLKPNTEYPFLNEQVYKTTSDILE